MNPARPFAIRLLQASFVMAMTLVAAAQEPQIGLPQDWSHRHVIYTNGGSPELRAAAAHDPRSWVQWTLRTGAILRSNPLNVRPIEDGARHDSTSQRFARRRPPNRTKNKNSKVDWSVSLGPTGGMPVGETPAKFGFNPNLAPDCANDFVVFVINARPAAGAQANIVALNKLYSGPAPNLCGTQPAFLWSYAVGNGAIFLSPVLSLDGKKVAFISASAPSPLFNVLTWVAGQGANATNLSVAPGGASSVATVDFTRTTVAGCTANPVGGDSNSSPFIDYNKDVAYVAADNGVLYRIKGVFKGVPTLDYCITVNAGAALTSPVYDPFSNKVFISDGQSVYAYVPGATSFTAAGSIAVAGTPASIILSPIVDVTSGFVYVFSSHNLANTNVIVSQMPESLATHTDAPIGPAFNGTYILDGAFDYQYIQNGPAAGSLYACGTQTGASTKPALYTISFQGNGTMNTVPAMSNNHNINGAANPAGTCSPLTEFFDGTTDRLFVGTGSIFNAAGANLVTMWNITNRITSPTAAPTATAINEIGGTSGFTIDNNATTQPQAASIYFGTLVRGANSPCGANLFCGVKLTQSGLQ